MTIPTAFLQELIARADIVDIVGRYVPLKKAGANFMGLCPFHGEKSPSFSVSPTKQFYHCFGCGVHGNAIGFLMEHAGMGFVDAVQDLAAQYGLQVPDEDLSPEERTRAAAQRQKQATLSDVLERAGEAYRKQLRLSPRAIGYLKSRGVSGEIAKHFGIGYAPEGWRSLASVFPAYDDPGLVESGLVITAEGEAGTSGERERRYDRFRDRIMFPIRNVKGELIGFGGRVLGDEKPKYLNSPETPLFSKGRELYGLFEARSALRDKGFVLVTEGYMDVVALAQLGFANAVATLGTACTAEHVHKLFRFTDSVIFSFDGDAAGRRAARKALEAALPHASDVRSVKFLFLPSEHDPDSFVREVGSAGFAEAVEQATPLSRFLLQAAAEDCDAGSAEGRARMASQARPLWSSMPDGALKRQLLADIAAQVHLDMAELERLWRPHRSGRERKPDLADAGPTMASEAPRARPPVVTPRAGLRGRRAPPARSEVAARILLTHMALWETLPEELQNLLCELPGEPGLLFRWLDSQWHEHGAQPWAALREGLRGAPPESFAVRVVHGPDGAEGDMHEAELSAAASTQELQSVLDFMLDDRLKAQQSEAIAAVGADPLALERYRALEARRLQLRHRLNPASSAP